MANRRVRNYTYQYRRLSSTACKPLLNGEMLRGSFFVGDSKKTISFKDGMFIYNSNGVTTNIGHSIVKVGFGEVVYFRCPHCRKNRLYLHMSGDQIACRGCFRLKYKYDSIDEFEALRNQIIKKRQALWGTDHPIYETQNLIENCRYWEKPKRMRHKTFKAKRNELLDLEHKYTYMMARKFNAFAGSFGIDLERFNNGGRLCE